MKCNLSPRLEQCCFLNQMTTPQAKEIEMSFKKADRHTWNEKCVFCFIHDWFYWILLQFLYGNFSEFFLELNLVVFYYAFDKDNITTKTSLKDPLLKIMCKKSLGTQFGCVSQIFLWRIPIDWSIKRYFLNIFVTALSI